MLNGKKLKIENFRTLFDFRPPNKMRREFNISKNEILEKLLARHGCNCMLGMGCCNLESVVTLDHLIPLSTNQLNKELRNLQPEKGKNVKSQSFGSNHIDNLIIACADCNKHKKHRILNQEKITKILIEKENYRKTS